MTGLGPWNRWSIFQPAMNHFLKLIAEKIEDLKKSGREPAEIILFMEGFVDALMATGFISSQQRESQQREIESYWEMRREETKHPSTMRETKRE